MNAQAFSPVIELRDPVHGPIAVSPAELDVIDSPIFQRLRGIKQLGFAEFVFPGAVHNRYLHSIGAMHLGGRVFDSLSRSADWLDAGTKQRFRQLVRLAALLHDIGHAPLSHAAEALMPMRRAMGLERLGIADGPMDGQAHHEEMTLKLLVDSPLTGVIDRAFAGLGIRGEHVAAVVGEHDCDAAATFVVGGVDHRPLLHAMVSGELDVDRMDYLLRDSYFTGVSYGSYDLDWLASNVFAVVQDNDAVSDVSQDERRPPARVARLGLDARAVTAFEHFLLARYHMFQMVYFHPKSDIFDAMLRAWLAEAGPDARFPADPDAFVGCDDAWLMRKLADTSDPWAVRVRQRRPLKLLTEFRPGLSGAGDSGSGDTRREAIDQALKDGGIEPLWLTAKPVLSRYALAPSHLRTNPLFVREHQPAGPVFRRIEEVTDLFDRYERQKRLERVYVPGEVAAKARALVAAIVP